MPRLNADLHSKLPTHTRAPPPPNHWSGQCYILWNPIYIRLESGLHFLILFLRYLVASFHLMRNEIFIHLNSSSFFPFPHLCGFWIICPILHVCSVSIGIDSMFTLLWIIILCMYMGIMGKWNFRIRVYECLYVSLQMKF